MDLTQISPLFHPVYFRKDHLLVLDETLLPEKEKYIKVRNEKEALLVLKEMKTRAYGQVLLYYYYVIIGAKNKKCKNKKALSVLLGLLTAKFKKARPTFAFEYFSNHIKSTIRSDEDVLRLDKIITGYIDSIENLRLMRARLFVNTLSAQTKIATHCNVSGELVLIAQAARESFKSIEFFVSETRPYLQGSRLTAWELARAGFRVNLFCDIQAGQVFSENKIDMVLVGADRATVNGDVVNKVGTYQLAVLAKHFNVPFYVIAQSPGDAKDISEIKIEYRDKKELIEFRGRRIAAKNQEALYPSFDITPAALVSKLVFFTGIFSPQEFSRLSSSGKKS